MRFLSTVATFLALIGGIFLLTALLSGGAAVLAFIERQRHGAGLLFADVELLGFMACICAVLGGLAVFGARKLAKRKQPDVS
jgi:hypothetical protein